MILEAFAIPLALLAIQPEDIFFAPDSALTKATCDTPPGLLMAPVRLSDFERQWYGDILAAAQEASLYAQSRGSSPKSTLRFAWLPSFQDPVVVRIEWGTGGNGRLIAKKLTRDRAPGAPPQTIDRALTPQEAAGIRSLLARERLFDLPSLDCDMGLDGAQWLFEQADSGGYRFIRRWSPEKGPPRAAGDALLKLTGWQFKHLY